MLKRPARAGRLPQGHGPLFRAPRRQGRDGRRLPRSASPTRPDATSRNSCAGTTRRARRRWRCPAIGTQRARTYRLDLAQATPPTPGQPHKEPMVIPLVVGLLGPDGRDLPLRLSDGSAVERGVLQLERGFAELHFRGCAHPAGGLARARFLGADQAHARTSRSRACASRRRTIPIRSTAGRRCRRWRRRCWSTIPRRRGPASRRGTTKAWSTRSTPFSTTARSSRRLRRRRSRSRRKPTSRAKSAATSIPMPSSRPAIRVARNAWTRAQRQAPCQL